MPWNWQLPDWPRFSYDAGRLLPAELDCARKAGIVVGAGSQLAPGPLLELHIELMSREAGDSAAIEGELLDRNSVQSSIRRQLGLAVERGNTRPAEAGMAELMVDLYRHPQIPLDHETLFRWHRMLCNGRRDLETIGGYRAFPEPMQIVSRTDAKPRIHFEAPPSERVPAEMDRFLAWLRDTAPAGRHPLPAVTRAGIGHLWFESIHPFEDGNGRIGRVIVEKTLGESYAAPVLTGIASALLKNRKAYYDELEIANQTLDINRWLDFFSAMVSHAQDASRTMIGFIALKTKLLDQNAWLNPRQQKAVLRLFEAGPEGFTGGLSAANYRAITDASPATATRDLAELTDRGILIRRGEQKGTRYQLAGLPQVDTQKP